MHIEHVSAKQPPQCFTWKVCQGGVAAVKMTGGALCVVVSTVSGELLSDCAPECPTMHQNAPFNAPYDIFDISSTASCAVLSEIGPECTV